VKYLGEFSHTTLIQYRSVADRQTDGQTSCEWWHWQQSLRYA